MIGVGGLARRHVPQARAEAPRARAPADVHALGEESRAGLAARRSRRTPGRKTLVTRRLLRCGRRRRRGQHAERVRREVQGHRRALLVGERRAVVRHHGLHEIAADEADVELAEAAEEHRVLDHPGQAVRPGAALILDPDALGADHRLDGAAHLGRTLLGLQRPLADLQRHAVRVSGAAVGAQEVRHAEEVGDEQRRRLLVDRLGRDRPARRGRRS